MTRELGGLRVGLWRGELTLQVLGLLVQVEDGPAQELHRELGTPEGVALFLELLRGLYGGMSQEERRLLAERLRRSGRPPQLRLG